MYLSGRIKAVIGKQPLVEGVSVEKQNVLYSYLKTIVENHGVKGHKRLQYATVWNNSVPALYYEVDKENGTLLGWLYMIIRTFIRIIYINLMMFM